jgi:hypothetical protein
VEVVSSAKDLKVVSIRNKRLSYVINLLRFLGLTSSLRKNDVGFDVENSINSHITFYAYKTCLFCMLKIEAVAFCYLSIDSLLYPSNLVDKFVAIFVEHFKSKSVLGIDDPNKKKTTFLNLVKWNFV